MSDHPEVDTHGSPEFVRISFMLVIIAVVVVEMILYTV